MGDTGDPGARGLDGKDVRKFFILMYEQTLDIQLSFGNNV